MTVVEHLKSEFARDIQTQLEARPRTLAPRAISRLVEGPLAALAAAFEADVLSAALRQTLRRRVPASRYGDRWFNYTEALARSLAARAVT